MKQPYITGFIAVLLILGGCSYSLRMNQYPHLRDVAVAPFENETLELFLEEELRDALISSFQQDGRLRIAYEDPDSRIEGRILDYSSTIYGYDIDQTIEEYQVRLVLSMTFTDLVRNEVIWENKNLTVSERYAPVGSSNVRWQTEEEALEEIFRELFRIIIRNSLESW
jgi:outer membrane lipopolysaccharide assembly protein LptE/RlpB